MGTVNNTAKVRVGQVWQDFTHGSWRSFMICDERRRFRIVEIGKTHAVTKNIRTGKKTRIRVGRLGSSKTGYELFRDVNGEEVTG